MVQPAKNVLTWVVAPWPSRSYLDPSYTDLFAASAKDEAGARKGIGFRV